MQNKQKLEYEYRLMKTKQHKTKQKKKVQNKKHK